MIALGSNAAFMDPSPEGVCRDEATLELDADGWCPLGRLGSTGAGPAKSEPNTGALGMATIRAGDESAELE